MSQLKRISGRDNPEFKRFSAVRGRKDRDLVLVEGPKLLDEAIKSSLAVRIVAIDDSVAHIREAWRLLPMIRLAGPLMKSLAAVETHQGVLALVARPPRATAWLVDDKAFVLILDGVQDPGNVGTLLRTAEAAGVSGVLLTRGCADPLSPKALRASAGSAFRLPHISDLSLDEIQGLLPQGVRIVAAVAGLGAVSAFGAPLDLPLALALGSEGSGLSPRLEEAAAIRVRVPQARDVESLNVAVAGGILMFQIASCAGILRN